MNKLDKFIIKYEKAEAISGLISSVYILSVAIRMVI